MRTWNYKKYIWLLWRGLGMDDALTSLSERVGWVSLASLSLFSPDPSHIPAPPA